MKYNLSNLMRKAWSLNRKINNFSEALKLAWRWIRVQAENDAKVEAIAEELGIEEEFHTWAGWQAQGRKVIHTSEAAFKVEVIDPTTKKGTRVKSFFVYSDTQEAA